MYIKVFTLAEKMSNIQTDKNTFDVKKQKKMIMTNRQMKIKKMK